MNGGGFWDDITANLPETAAAHGVTADRASGAIYVATDAGVFFTATDLGSAGRPGSWTLLSAEPARGRGHRREVGRGREPDLCRAGWIWSLFRHRTASAARCTGGKRGGLQRPAGGAGSAAERAGGARGIGHERRCGGAGSGCVRHRIRRFRSRFRPKEIRCRCRWTLPPGALTFQVPLRSVSPAIFVDPEGTPLIMDAASGILLDSSKPARASSRIQVLATGFGQVKPDWPTGLAAPLNDPPAGGRNGACLSGRIAGGSDASVAGAGIRWVLFDRDPGPADYQHGSGGVVSGSGRTAEQSCTVVCGAIGDRLLSRVVQLTSIR